jgi:hypothetical protein
MLKNKKVIRILNRAIVKNHSLHLLVINRQKLQIFLFENVFYKFIIRKYVFYLLYNYLFEIKMLLNLKYTDFRYNEPLDITNQNFYPVVVRYIELLLYNVSHAILI